MDQKTTIHPSLINVAGWVLLVLSIFSTSCKQESFVYDHNFPGDCWLMTDTLSFDVEKGPEDKEFLVHLFLGQDFPFQNLHIKSLIDGPIGKTQVVSLNQIFLDPVGTWLVPKEGAGYHVVYDQPLVLTGDEGTYTIKLVQNMRPASVCEVKKVGVQVN
jgi:gliding motility-associated lipoprotein GldH